MAEDLMRYDQLAQNALRGVVRDALRKIERYGLPGDHHFYIAFNTRFPGVTISERLLQRYPREMTIVIQHQYSELEIHEDRFQVVLFFDQIAERLIVPFNAIKGFLDPAVQFGLQFEVVTADEKPAEKPSLETVVAAPMTDTDGEPKEAEHKVVSLDSFRKK
jgi:uncharacterized protein